MCFRVLVLRPAGKAAGLIASLAARGHSPVLLTLTEIRPIPHTIPGDAAGYVLTSPSAAAALPPEAIERPVFTVGAATGQAARDRGCRRVEPGAGTSEAMLKDLARRPDVPAGLVWLSGQDVSVDVAGTLTAAGKVCRRIIVYENAALDLPDETLRQAFDPLPDSVLLQSAKAAHLLLGHARHLKIDMSPLTAVSLSPRIDASLQGSEIARRTVAGTPDDAGLLAELDRLSHNRAG